MPNRLTYKNLFTLVKDEIEKRQKYPYVSDYDKQLSRDKPLFISTEAGSGRVDVDVADVITAVHNLLRETLQPTIISGLTVSATSPISNKVVVSSGKGSVGGEVYELASDITLTIPFNSYDYVFYINLYKDTIEVETNQHSSKLTVAKIIVPKPGTTSLVQDTKDDSWNAYIVNFREVHFYQDSTGKLEEDSIEVLRDSIGKVLADNLIGNIRLSENLKIINTAGSLELNSDSLKLYDINNSLLAKFNTNGVYFYNAAGTELARFTNIDARIGNILITENSIQSENFVEGSNGFRIKDDGTVEFSDGTFRGNLEASTGTIGGWTITSDKLYATTTGIIQTGANVGTGYDGVRLDKDGLHVYNSTLGRVVYLPSDGSSPQFSSGTIEQTIFEINTNSVLRTSETVGDGGAESAGVLINNTGLYGCGANQTLADANLKALVDGTIRLSGEITSTQGQIGSVTITQDKLSGGLIEGTNITSPLVQTSSTLPRIRMDTLGLCYQVTTSVGKYGQFKYGDGTLYGVGVLAYLFKENYPIFSVLTEHNLADIRLYNRSEDPGSGTGPHQVGDLIVVNGDLKICDIAGSPGTFTALQKLGGKIIIENRTGDPSSPETGRIWIRTDL